MTEVTHKFINSVDSCVDDALRGFVTTYPQLVLHPKQRFITSRENGKTAKVGVLSGGGSGHEPYTIGYVGAGMLAGAVAGGVFASPPGAHVLHAITNLHAQYEGGVFVVIPNYTGDRLNFGMAAEKAKNMGMKVKTLIVGEDVASGENCVTGARGLCGLLYIYKISGALSDEGFDLETIADTAREILKNMATLGITLSVCSLPGQGPLYLMNAGCMDVGGGVHGEAGCTRVAVEGARPAVTLVLESLLAKLALNEGDRVVASINNLGGLTQLEISILCGEVAEQLKNKGIKVERVYAGSLMTCLDARGFQVSLLRLDWGAHGDEWLRLLDRDTDAPCWPRHARTSVGNINQTLLDVNELKAKTKNIVTGGTLTIEQGERFSLCLQAAAQTFYEHEADLNRLDAGCGDGDCGSTLKQLADGVMELVATGPQIHPADSLQKLSEVAETRMGGTSGALYCLGLAAASRSFTSKNDVTLETWAECWLAAVDTISTYGGAVVGDRTMVDTLKPAADAFYLSIKKGLGIQQVLRNTLEEAERGCASTATLTARAGRASYVRSVAVSSEDAGARATLLWIRAVAGVLKQQ